MLQYGGGVNLASRKVISYLNFLLQTEKIELETTVVDETKERESYGQGDRRFSGQSSTHLWHFHNLSILLKSMF